MLTPLLPIPLAVVDPWGWPRLNLEMHLLLNSELVSNEFVTEFALNLHLKSESTVRG